MGEVTYLIEIEASTGSDTIFSLPDVEITRALALEPHEQSMVLFVADVLTDELRTVTWLPTPLPAPRLGSSGEKVDRSSSAFGLCRRRLTPFAKT